MYRYLPLKKYIKKHNNMTFRIISNSLNEMYAQIYSLQFKHKVPSFPIPIG